MKPNYTLAGALTGAFLTAGTAGEAAAQWYIGPPVFPYAPPVVISPEEALESCILDALESQSVRPGVPIPPQYVPDTKNPSVITKTYFMDSHEKGGIFMGNMIVIDHLKRGTGSLSVASFHVHAHNKDLDPDKPQPVGQGTITRILIAREDVGMPGPRDTFSGPEAKAPTVKRIRQNASDLVDNLRVCMGFGP